MQSREKTLLFILLGFLGLWVGYSIVQKTVVAPISSRTEQIAALKDRIDVKDLQEVRLLAAQSNLAKWKGRSLPPDARNAQRLYRAWLIDLAAAAGLQDVQPTNGRRRRDQRKTEVPVVLQATATLSQLGRFLYYFHHTDLLHRIESLQITSEQREGDPRLNVTLTAVGLALHDAPERDRLFPEAQLAADAPAGAEAIEVEAADGFPQATPFRVLVGYDLMTVTKVEGRKWSVRPGIDESEVTATESLDGNFKGETVQLLPVAGLDDERDLDYYRRLAWVRGRNPFVPLEPVLVAGDQIFARGETLEFTVKAENYDPQRGRLEYRLEEGSPRGMTIDPETGRITWTPASDVLLGKYTAKVRVDQAGVPLVAGDVAVTLREINSRPSIEPVAELTASIGERVEFAAKASDPDRDQKLTFSLRDAPEGARIDPETGRFEWTPGDAVEPGRHTFDLVVSDDGAERESASTRVTINVRDDTARFTKLIAIVTEGTEREAWLYDLATRTKTVLREFLPFEAAGIQGTVLAIGGDFVLLTAEGATWRLELGEDLRSMQKVTVASPPSAAPERTAAKSGGATKKNGVP